MENRLIELKKKILYVEKQRSKHKDLEVKYKELIESLNIQKSNWKKEQRDIDKLENGSFSSFFYQLAGKLEKKIEKEELEALQAKRMHESTMHEAENVKTEIEILTLEINDAKRLVEEYDDLWKQKEKEFLEKNSCEREEYFKYIDQIARNKSIHKELSEALNAGNNLLKELSKAKKEFQSAKNWGTYDILGGGSLSSIIKHSHIDSANKILESVDYLSRVFEKELKDVNIDSKYTVNGFEKCADIFFDNFFSDVMVQDKINKVLNNIEKTINYAETRVEDLKRTIEDIEFNIGKLIQKKNTLIEEF